MRDGARHAEILYGIPDTTYQAYNFWGGKSLYDDKSTGAVTVAGTPRAVKVSFDRPYIQPHDGIMRDWYTRADYRIGRLARALGLRRRPTTRSRSSSATAPRVQDHRVFISGAHDEYYSAAMRSALLQARDRGIDLFFTGANEVYWKIRFEQPGVQSGAQDRALVNYKSTQSGPADPSGIPTGTWRDPAGANAPENSLTGLMYIGAEELRLLPAARERRRGQGPDLALHGAREPARGRPPRTSAPTLVGWEWDARVSNGQEPPGVTTLASSPVNGDILQDAGRVYAAGNAITT